MDTSVPVELVSIEPLLNPVKHFIEPLNSVVSSYDTNGFLNDTERLHAKPLVDSQ